MMKQDKAWWKEYWKKSKEATRQDLENKRKIEEEKHQYAITHFEPTPTVSAPNYMEWKGQHEGHNY